MRATLVDRPIDPARLLAEISAPENGASILFVGTVREVNEGRAVTGIDYSAYAAMAKRELDLILGEMAARFGTRHVVLEHRLGTLAVGDASVAIAVAHSRRGAAYEASRFVIEELKRRVPIWKREHYADGTREWVDPTRGAAAPPGIADMRRNSGEHPAYPEAAAVSTPGSGAAPHPDDTPPAPPLMADDRP